MSQRTIVRGDTYVIRRAVFVVTAVQLDLVTPFDFSGCTVRMTFRATPVPIATDSTDSTAALKGTIAFTALGAVSGSPENMALPVGGTAAQGVLWLTATAAITAALPLGTILHFDVQVTDANGEILTAIMPGTLTAVDGYTNRTN